MQYYKYAVTYSLVICVGERHGRTLKLSVAAQKLQQLGSISEKHQMSTVRSRSAETLHNISASSE
jgi:hypothetical protein